MRPGVRPETVAVLTPAGNRTRGAVASPIAVAKMLGLEEFLNRKPSALSGGQRQRVAMGRAIVREPQAFLMDEPLSNLDAVRDTGPCVVFAGHRLPVPAAVIEARPGLERFFDQEVILGVRPSDFEDAELADPSWARMPVKADVTEKLGSEIHVIFTLDAPIVEHSSLSQAISDEDDDSAIALAGGKSQWTARVAARSHVKPGERIELAIDASGPRSSIPTAGWPSVTRWTRRLRFLAPALPLAQPFTAPAVSPDTTDRRKTNTRIPIGTRATTLAAKMVP